MVNELAVTPGDAVAVAPEPPPPVMASVEPPETPEPPALKKTPTPPLDAQFTVAGLALLLTSWPPFSVMLRLLNVCALRSRIAPLVPIPTGNNPAKAGPL